MTKYTWTPAPDHWTVRHPQRQHYPWAWFILTLVTLLAVNTIYEYGLATSYIIEINTTPVFVRETVLRPSSELIQPHKAPKLIYAQVTKYTKVETCPKTECITASGRVATVSRSAACPRSITLGTRIRIAGKVYSCDDHTSKVWDGRYDIYSHSYEEALAWGIRTLPVLVYAE